MALTATSAPSKYGGPTSPWQSFPGQWCSGAVVVNIGLLVRRDGCKVMQHGDLLTTLTDNTISANYANSTNYAKYVN